MEDGTFVAINKDQRWDAEFLRCVRIRMKHLKEKFGLDRIAETRLSDILARCTNEKKEEYYHDLERRAMATSQRP